LSHRDKKHRLLRPAELQGNVTLETLDLSNRWVDDCQADNANTITDIGATAIAVALDPAHARLVKVAVVLPNSEALQFSLLCR
jgi:hypothetical protein